METGNSPPPRLELAFHDLKNRETSAVDSNNALSSTRRKEYLRMKHPYMQQNFVHALSLCFGKFHDMNMYPMLN
jgi:hypothetical protein